MSDMQRGRQIFLAHVSQSGSSSVSFYKLSLSQKGNHTNISVDLKLRGQKNPNFRCSQKLVFSNADIYHLSFPRRVEGGFTLLVNQEHFL